jgi:hypothetical protein
MQLMRSLLRIVHLCHAHPIGHGGIQTTELGGPVIPFFNNLKESL